MARSLANFSWTAAFESVCVCHTLSTNSPAADSQHFRSFDSDADLSSALRSTE